MDRISMPDRLESATPVRNPGPENSARGDAQRKERKRPPKPEESEEQAEAAEEQDSHQLDELA